MFQDNQVLQQTYRYYSYFIYGSFVIFIITAYVELIIMLNGDVLKMDAICSNICLTLAFTCSALRATVMRVGPNLLKIIEQVMHAEKTRASIEDQTVKALLRCLIVEFSSNCCRASTWKERVSKRCASCHTCTLWLSL